jgi:hypothetical protein
MHMKRISGTLGSIAMLALVLATASWAAPKAQPYSDLGAAAARDASDVSAARVAEPFRALAAFTDPVAAAQAIGNRLVDLQSDVTEDNAGNGAVDADNNDGGWDWVVTGATAHPSTPSYENLYGPIARGLVDAAILSGDPRLATGAGDVFAGISRPGAGLTGFPYFRIFDADLGAAYVRWADHTGDAALKDTLKARHDQELLVRGGAGGRARTIRNGRVGQGLNGMWPWDVHLLSNDCDALRGAFPGSAAQYGAELDSVAQVLLDDLNGLLGPNNWNPADFAQNYHQLGIAGALRAFDASPRADDDALATALRDTLVNGQLADGSWGVSYGGSFYGQDLQATAYAVLALMEYSSRHGDAAARQAAVLGQKFLLGYVSAAGVVDDGNGEYAETAAEVAQALLTGDPVAPVAPATCISAGNPCVAVPVRITRIDTTPMRGFSVTLTLSSNLQLCPSGIVPGTYLSGAQFQVLNPSAGVYLVDAATLGLPCGATGDGTLFTLNLQSSSPTGTGTVTVNSVIARDCMNGPVSAIPGPAATVVIDQAAPSAIADLAAAQRTTGNDADGTTQIQLTFTAPVDAAAVEVYRAPFGSYPEYDDASGAPPASPGYPPGAPWSLTPVTASAQYDELGPCMSGTSHLEVFGTFGSSDWADPRTNYAYRMSGTAVGKNNHNVPPGPPTGFPTGTPDPNLATIEYFRLPQGGTLTISGSFVTPLTSANFASDAGQFLTAGLINKPWVDFATGPSFGYSSGMFNTNVAGANGNAYLLFYRNGGNVRTAMEDHNSGNVTSPDQRDVASVSSFSIQFQDGLDKNGAPVATGGRMRYALDGGAYGPWDDNSHDFRQLTALQLGAYTVDGGLLSADFGTVCGAIRDFWHYVAFVRDGCGNVSAASNLTGGTLNYHLGDVSNNVTPGNGDNLVSTADISLLGAHYGVSLAFNDPFNYLDVGPTTDYSVNARPTTDNKVDFEDLMMFAINYGVVSAPQDLPTAAAEDAIALAVPKLPAVGESFAVPVRMSGAGDVLGASLTLGWDAAVVEPVGVEAGELLLRQGREALTLSSAPGVVDFALMGAGAGVRGEGEVVRVTFRVRGAGDPALTLKSVVARDAANRPVSLGGSPAAVPAAPSVSGLALAAPNPFTHATSLQLSLAREAQVRVTVFDLSGRRVRTLLDGLAPAGVRLLAWDGRNDAGTRVSAGLYVIKLDGAGISQSRRVLLVP